MPTKFDNPDILLVWPRERVGSPPSVSLPLGYSLRTWHDTDVDAWVRVQLHAMPTFDEPDMRRWLERYLEIALPFGIFVVTHDDTNEVVATAGCVHNSRNGAIPFCGQLAWVATRPNHQKQGIGTAVSAAATTRLAAIGYENIAVCTGDELHAAIKVYLNLGYLPYLYEDGMEQRWRDIMINVGQTFEPEKWPNAAAAATR